MSHPHDPDNPQGPRDPRDYDSNQGPYSDDPPTRAFSQVPDDSDYPDADTSRAAGYGSGQDSAYSQGQGQGQQHTAGPGDSPVTHYQQSQEQIAALQHENADQAEQIDKLAPFRTWAIILGIIAAVLLAVLIALLLVGENEADRTTTVGDDGQTTVTETATVTSTESERRPDALTITETETDRQTETQTETTTQTQVQTETQTTSVTVTPTDVPGDGE